MMTKPSFLSDDAWRNSVTANRGAFWLIATPGDAGFSLAWAYPTTWVWNAWQGRALTLDETTALLLVVRFLDAPSDPRGIIRFLRRPGRTHQALADVLGTIEDLETWAKAHEVPGIIPTTDDADLHACIAHHPNQGVPS